MEEIQQQIQASIQELFKIASLEKGNILVIGCSTSEIAGAKIGSCSNIEIAENLWKCIEPAAIQQGIYIAVQCCEHLNRALVIEKELADKKGWEIVNVVPALHAGGAFAMTAYKKMIHPVLVEHIKAEAGMDIGNTLIGMHLKDVAVPVRLENKKIGEAHLVCARTRPKYIGGERAKY